MQMPAFQNDDKQKTRRPIRVMELRSTYRWGGGPDKTILNSAKLWLSWKNLLFQLNIHLT